MKKITVLLLLLGGIILNACSSIKIRNREIFYTSQCDCAGKIPDFNVSNSDWKKYQVSIVDNYRQNKDTPKISGGANGIIIYYAKKKDREAFEQMLCEFWKNKFKKLEP